MLKASVIGLECSGRLADGRSRPVAAVRTGHRISGCIKIVLRFLPTRVGHTHLSAHSYSLPSIVEARCLL